MPIHGPKMNPFQLPQFGQQSVQKPSNPFQSMGGGAPSGGSAAGGGQAPMDGLAQFKSQIAGGGLNANLSSPAPAQGLGQRLLTSA